MKSGKKTPTKRTTANQPTRPKATTQQESHISANTRETTRIRVVRTKFRIELKSKKRKKATPHKENLGSRMAPKAGLGDAKPPTRGHSEPQHNHEGTRSLCGTHEKTGGYLATSPDDPRTGWVVVVVVYGT